MKMLNTPLTLCLASLLLSLSAHATPGDLPVCDLDGKLANIPCVLSPSMSHLEIANMLFANHAAQEKVIAMSRYSDPSVEGGVVTLIENSEGDATHGQKTVARFEVLMDDCTASNDRCEKESLWTVEMTAFDGEKPIFKNSIAQATSRIQLNFGRHDPENADAITIGYIRNRLGPAISF